MSGHSKWSNIKNHKQATDSVRAQVFTKLANAIIIAVKENGGNCDPQSNFKLRLCIEKAREVNMPKANIQRAIDRASGKGENIKELHEVIYEGFAKGAVAVLIQGVTDNKQRTVSEVKNIFTRFGGNLGGVGSVGYLFKKVGELHFTKKITYDAMLELVLEANALDLEEEDDRFIVICDQQQMHRIKDFFMQKNLDLLKSELIYQPVSTVEIFDKNILKNIIDLLTALEEQADIHKVYANFITKENL